MLLTMLTLDLENIKQNTYNWHNSIYNNITIDRSIDDVVNKS